MDYVEECCLAFTANNINFLIPVSRVKRVCDAIRGTAEGKDMPVLNFPVIAGRKEERQWDYILIIEIGQTAFGLLAEEILGVRVLEEKELLPLHPPVLNERNQYLQAVEKLNGDDGKAELGYLLNPEQLYQRIINDSGSPPGSS